MIKSTLTEGSRSEWPRRVLTPYRWRKAMDRGLLEVLLGLGVEGSVCLVLVLLDLLAVVSMRLLDDTHAHRLASVDEPDVGLLVLVLVAGLV
eukprot:XP_001703970.1 Hypothetical protein GL50803_98655 [Giardia lamblia ATCC 50803]